MRVMVIEFTWRNREGGRFPWKNPWRRRASQIDGAFEIR
jgi:hypothetical protein